MTSTQRRKSWPKYQLFYHPAINWLHLKLNLLAVAPKGYIIVRCVPRLLLANFLAQEISVYGLFSGLLA